MTEKAQLDNIFEVKIKEDKICQAFLTLENELLRLQQQLTQLQQSQPVCQFDSNRPKVTLFFNQLLQSQLQPLLQRINQQEQSLQTLEYNHQNLCQNMGD